MDKDMWLIIGVLVVFLALGAFLFLWCLIRGGDCRGRGED